MWKSGWFQHKLYEFFVLPNFSEKIIFYVNLFENSIQIARLGCTIYPTKIISFDQSNQKHSMKLVRNSVIFLQLIIICWNFQNKKTQVLNLKTSNYINYLAHWCKSCQGAMVMQWNNKLHKWEIKLNIWKGKL
jgi:hypothetical protein